VVGYGVDAAAGARVGAGPGYGVAAAVSVGYVVGAGCGTSLGSEVRGDRSVYRCSLSVFCSPLSMFLFIALSLLCSRRQNRQA